MTWANGFWYFLKKFIWYKKFIHFFTFSYKLQKNQVVAQIKINHLYQQLMDRMILAVMIVQRKIKKMVLLVMNLIKELRGKVSNFSFYVMVNISGISLDLVLEIVFLLCINSDQFYQNRYFFGLGHVNCWSFWLKESITKNNYRFVENINWRRDKSLFKAIDLTFKKNISRHSFNIYLYCFLLFILSCVIQNMNLCFPKSFFSDIFSKSKCTDFSMV